MKVWLNGEEKETGCEILKDFLVECQIIAPNQEAYGLAVGVNEEIVPKKHFDDFALKENDRIEVFTMVAGG